MVVWPRQQCKTMVQMHKGRYDGYLHKGSLRNCGWGRLFWMTNLEKYKTADLIWESKRRFGLVVKLIANKYYEDTFYFLSFLPMVFTFPSSTSHTCLISLYRIIRKIIWLVCSYLKHLTLAKFFVTLWANGRWRASNSSRLSSLISGIRTSQS